MDELPVINPALLNAEQQKSLHLWQEMFASPAWTQLVEHEQPMLEVLQNSYHGVEGEQMLGRTQGALGIYYRFLVHLPNIVNLEFLSVTGQLEEMNQEGQPDDDPVTVGNWRY